ncbi:MAG: universal stress protein [Planctomycetes bacterium]|nr:universal stress protein [Planctomycetota bacterium]
MSYRILVALDGSPASEAALHEVERIAVGGAAVHLLRVVPTLPLSVSAPSAGVMDFHDQALSYLGKLRETFPDLRGLDLIRTGDPADAILQAALEFNIDLIAMGTQLRTGPAKAFPGSLAGIVVQRSQLPVLFRQPGPLPDCTSLRRILVPLDGTEDSLTILPAVQNLALRIRAEVVFLHVSAGALAPAAALPAGDPRAKLLSLADRFDKTDLVFWQTIAEGDPVEEILSHARTLDADLIAMAAPAVKEADGTTVGRAALAVLGRAEQAVLLQKPGLHTVVSRAWMYQ